MKTIKIAEDYYSFAEHNRQQQRFVDALKYYNLCLCFAPKNSHLIRYTLLNRSKIYFQAKQFQHALDNFNWAQEITPFKQMSELDSNNFLKMVLICRDEIAKVPIPEMDFFELSLPLNKKLPFISDCIKLIEDATYGRYIITSKDLNPGDVVVAEEPFYKVISDKVSHQRCCICCSTNMSSLIPCLDCSKAMFCSNKCKDSTIHKRECKSFENETNTLEERMLQRMFYQAIDICGSVEQLKSLALSETNEKTILDFDLKDNVCEVNKTKIILSVFGLDKRDPVTEELHSRYNKIIDRLMSETSSDRDFIKSYLTKCLQSLTVNFFHFHWSAFDDAEAKGFALCTLSAFFAHSCYPNVEKIDVDNKFVFVARRPIKAGEQLNMCYDRYSFMNYPLDERQRYLKTVYKFDCRCIACVYDYPRYEFEVNHLLTTEEAEQKYRQNCEFIDTHISLPPSEQLCKLMAENIHLASKIANDKTIITI